MRVFNKVRQVNREYIIVPANPSFEKADVILRCLISYIGLIERTGKGSEFKCGIRYIISKVPTANPTKIKNLIRQFHPSAAVNKYVSFDISKKVPLKETVAIFDCILSWYLRRNNGDIEEMIVKFSSTVLTGERTRKEKAAALTVRVSDGIKYNIDNPSLAKRMNHRTDKLNEASALYESLMQFLCNFV